MQPEQSAEMMIVNWVHNFSLRDKARNRLEWGRILRINCSKRHWGHQYVNIPHAVIFLSQTCLDEEVSLYQSERCLHPFPPGSEFVQEGVFSSEFCFPCSSLVLCLLMQLVSISYGWVSGCFNHWMFWVITETSILINIWLQSSQFLIRFQNSQSLMINLGELLSS